ncbi:hypothetical protein ACFC0S_14915 [Streptomyces sp. NPDC056084]
MAADQGRCLRRRRRAPGSSGLWEMRKQRQQRQECRGDVCGSKTSSA